MKIDPTLTLSALATLTAVSTFLVTLYQEHRLKTSSIMAGEDPYAAQKSAIPNADLNEQLIPFFSEKRHAVVVFANPPFGLFDLSEKAPATQSDQLSEHGVLDFFEEVNTYSEGDWRNAESLRIPATRFPSLARTAT
jgi:hypothetical protein